MRTVIYKGSDIELKVSPMLNGDVIDFSEVTDFKVSLYQKKDDILAELLLSDLIPYGSPQVGFIAPFLASSFNNCLDGALFAQVEFSINDTNYTDPRKYVLSDIFVGDLKSKA